MRTFMLFFGLQFTLYLLVTVNFRAIAQARYGWTILTDTLISGAQFWIIRKVGTSAESLVAWSGFVFGGAVGSTAGIWLSKKAFRKQTSDDRVDKSDDKKGDMTRRKKLRKNVGAIVTQMQKPEGVAIATWVQSGAVLISLIFIGYQVQQQTNLSRAANVQTSVGLITPLNLKLVEPDMAEIWREGSGGFKKGVPANPDDVRSDQYETLLATYLVFYENAYWQNRQGLLNNEIYNGWDVDLKSFIKENQRTVR
jgi:hypothetical protein